MKKMISAALLIMLSFVISNAVADSFDGTSKNKKGDSFAECLPSTAASCVVGAFTGGLTRYLEKEFKIKQSKEHIIILMIMWWLEHKARHKVINSLEKDFKESD